MEDMDKTFDNIDDLARRIEQRIQELENGSEADQKEGVYDNRELGENMDELSALIADIDRRIQELEDEEQQEKTINLDIDDLTEKINIKLDKLDFGEETSDDLDKTLYDLNEISKIINETVKKLERQKEKKRKKAMYCDMARKKARETKKNTTAKKNKK